MCRTLKYMEITRESIIHSYHFLLEEGDFVVLYYFSQMQLYTRARRSIKLSMVQGAQLTFKAFEARFCSKGKNQTDPLYITFTAGYFKFFSQRHCRLGRVPKDYVTQLLPMQPSTAKASLRDGLPPSV